MSFLSDLREQALPDGDPAWRSPTEEELNGLTCSLMLEALQRVRERGNHLRVFLLHGVAESTAPENYTGGSDSAEGAPLSQWGAAADRIPLQVHMSELEMVQLDPEFIRDSLLEERPYYLFFVGGHSGSDGQETFSVAWLDALSPEGMYRREGMTRGPTGPRYLENRELPSQPPPYAFWARPTAPPMALEEAIQGAIGKAADIAAVYRAHPELDSAVYAIGRGAAVLSATRDPVENELREQLMINEKMVAVTGAVHGPRELERARKAGCEFLLCSFSAALAESQSEKGASDTLADFNGRDLPDGAVKVRLLVLADIDTLLIRLALLWDPRLQTPEPRSPVEEWGKLPIPEGMHLQIANGQICMSLGVNLREGKVVDLTPPAPLTRETGDA